MAKVTITLTLAQATAVRSCVFESLALTERVLLNPSLRKEYEARGDEGLRGWKGLEEKYGLLEAALREFG